MFAAALALVTVFASDIDACASIRAQAQAAHDASSLARAAALLPQPMAQQVAGEVGRADLPRALITLRTAAALACPANSTAPDTAALTSLRDSDERFFGVRVDESVLDRLLERLWALLESLLESETMQRFSEHTRTVYLTLLAIVVVLVAFRVSRGPRASTAENAVDNARIERLRKDAYARCREQAIALVDSDARTALLWARRALLARVGEVDEGAVMPQHTSTEVLAALDERTATIAAPALHAFDAAFYGDDATSAHARAVLEHVERAHTALGGGR